MKKAAAALFLGAATLGAAGVTGIYKNKAKNFNIKTEDIEPSLRLESCLIRTFDSGMSEGFVSFGNKAIEVFVDGMNLALRVKYEEKFIVREDGTQLRVCVYSPKENKSDVPGLLWIHGGGFAIGAPEQDFTFIEKFVLASGCVVVAPAYRKSDKAPYPAAFDDCYTSLLWLRDNGKDYGMRDDQIFVGGNSAGGGLCAAVTLAARDRGDVNVAFQMPLYPMLDDRMITASSQNNDAPIWNTKNNEFAWKLYLGNAYGTDKVSKYAAPARETDYSGLPPTVTYIGTVEPFYDETLQYVENLREAGVDVKIKVFDGCFHAFDLFFYRKAAKEAREFLLQEFMYATENYFAEQKQSLTSEITL